MKLKTIVVVLALALLTVGSVYALEKWYLELDGADGYGKAKIRVTEASTTGQDNTYVNIHVRHLMQPSDMIFEGWLVDDDTGYKLSLGSFNTNNFGHGKLMFNQKMVNFHLYDKVVITTEPIQDDDPNPGVAVMEVEIED